MKTTHESESLRAQLAAAQADKERLITTGKSVIHAIEGGHYKAPQTRIGDLALESLRAAIDAAKQCTAP